MRALSDNPLARFQPANHHVQKTADGKAEKENDKIKK
jgi:hypothetical protein